MKFLIPLNVLTVTTDKKEEGGTETEGRQWILGTFASPQLYTKHEKWFTKGNCM